MVTMLANIPVKANLDCELREFLNDVGVFQSLIGWLIYLSQTFLD